MCMRLVLVTPGNTAKAAIPLPSNRPARAKVNRRLAANMAPKAFRALNRLSPRRSSVFILTVEGGGG